MIPSISFPAAAQENGNGEGNPDSVTTSSHDITEPTTAGIHFSMSVIAEQNRCALVCRKQNISKFVFSLSSFSLFGYMGG